MSKKELNFKDREISPIQRFFIICSGADKTIIEDCPTEWNKYTGIGATILFTGVLAALSGGYALYTVFRNGELSTVDTSALLPAFLFGILWGLIIFNLDRFIVSTFHKLEENVWWKKWGQELLHALPRVILAVIIAIVISKPIEIKIFESRLADQIKQNEIDTQETNVNKIKDIYQLEEREKKVNVLNNTITELTTKLSTDPQNVKDLINNDLVRANNELTSILNTNNPKINTNRRAREAIHNNPESYIYTTDSLGNRINTGDYTQRAKDRRYVLYQEIQRWEKEIKDKQDNITKINEQIESERVLYRQQKMLEITKTEVEKDSAQIALTNAERTADKEVEDANKTTEIAFTNNFITQIEALGDLTEKDSTMWWTSLMITLLFLTIELAPILTKLITKRGCYDEKLDRIEYENMVEQKSIISQISSEINEHLRRAEEAAKLSGNVMIQKQKDKLNAELANNKIILDTIAKYQQELALEAIRKWYEEQKEKINNSKPCIN